MYFLGFAIATTLFAFAALVMFLVYPPLWRDLLSLRIMVKFLRNFIKAVKNRELIVDRFEKHVAKDAAYPMILFKEESYTYRDVDSNACKVADFLMKEGVCAGDTVALLMSNEPAYIWIYLGVQKMGAKLALINHHLVSTGLLHCIQACGAKLLIVGDGISGDYLPGKVFKLRSSLRDEISIFCYNPPREGVTLPSLSHFMADCPADPVDPNLRSNVELGDPSVYIYTSGTTGLPKPAIITHRKALLCSHSYAATGFSKKDVLYLPLPMYHASGMNLSVLNVINQGATLVLTEKFSASQFWSVCVRHKVTLVQYIGEMMRYLINSPPTPGEKKHQVWALVGNGLRRDVWQEIRRRFNVPHIFEFYGSTEVPASLTNYFNEEGSVGRLSPLMSYLSGQVLVDVDHTTQQPHRDGDGRCCRTLPGGSGMLIARLSSKVTFDGYLGQPSATNSKIFSDVFQKGDSYVNTNDVFYLDHDYNVFFKDRLGDSIRWKGENVSPLEVSNVLIGADFVQDANVYGVTVPGCEGKTGMAAISLKSGQELDEDKVKELEKLSNENLPGFARPRFLRFQRQMSLTSTFKQNKLELAQEGFDIKKVHEPMYFLNRKDGLYQPLDDNSYQRIIEGSEDL